MAPGHSDPKLLYAIEGINAYQIINGREESLTPSGPQTLSLLMVPTSSGFADPSSINTEEDFYLHLHLPPELDLPMPATTQIYHQPPTSYLIPRWDMGPDSGAFTRIQFPSATSRPGVQEDVDTFETILAQCTAFLERAQAPRDNGAKAREAGVAATPSRKQSKSEVAVAKAREAAGEELPPYNPGDYGPGEAYVGGTSSSRGPGGQIVLVNEEDGSVIGELGEGFNVVEDNKVKHGTKDPVVVTLPEDGSHNIAITPADESYEGRHMHPAYKKSTLVSGATRASQLLITTSDMVTRGLQAGADSFTKSTKRLEPVTFNPTTHDHIRRINTFSTKAAGLSAATVGAVAKYAQNFGANITRRKDGGTRGYDKDGNPIDSYKPGVLNKSLMAFNTVIDGAEQAGRNILVGTSSSVTTMVGHRWGPEAGTVADHLGGGVKNVGLVYIDVTGVSRRAIIKSVAKGMVVGNVKGGGQVIVRGSTDSPSDGRAGPSNASTPGAAAATVHGDNDSLYSDGRSSTRKGKTPY
ncbi:hypothetical protein GMORB2_6538 [Geosmithia morbida]|uniref:Senescence domain-containing protein n=1 Tax=Geosmithia morbida TaxID=1094350 RepID=A0A9P5D4P3_9HYPO|nr:uncharacterized protein GMORB2_6538 [Geosmithia morbida]KAF4122990.1 hypothetical protein GMORB2_6538 [Geosmithia morbida]